MTTRSAALSAFLAANADAVVCELTAVRGSSPRAQGTFMLVAATDLFGTIGGGLGPVVAGSLFDATGNYRIAWAVCLGFTVLAFLLVVGLRPQGLSTLKSTGAGSS